LVEDAARSDRDGRFGKYTLIAKLATGGMGEIFLAKLTGAAGFEKLVVIKRLLPHLVEDRHFVTMLLDEARIAARLSHPNVCQVFDLGEVSGQYYIAMEYLEGVPCSQLLRRSRNDDELLEVPLAAGLLIQVCDGLHHAHQLCDAEGEPVGLVHRDVTPSNVFATVTGMVKVLDFGVAKSRDAQARTHTGALKGKYAYMSPEQVQAEELDRRSDIFSLGIVLFELLTTRRLFWRESEYKMFQAIAEEPIPDVRDFRADVPAPLAAVVKKALSRDRDGRFATAAEMGAAVAAAMAPLGGVAPAAAVAEHVLRRFDDQIRERRELVLTSVSPQHHPTVADGTADMGEHSHEIEAPTVAARIGAGIASEPGLAAETAGVDEMPTAAAPAPSEAAVSKKPWRLVGGATAVAAVAAVTVAFALGYSRGSTGDPAAAAPGVIVVEKGSVEREGPGAEADPSASVAGQAPAASAPARGGGAGEAHDARPRTTPVAGRTATVRLGADPYSAALSARALEKCIATHAAAVDELRATAANRVALHVTIERSGKARGVVVATPALRGSRLGRCLKSVAAGSRFPRHDQKQLVVEIFFAI
jgi:serine/threonine-protein kinase